MYKPKEIEKIFNKVTIEIAHKGKSIRSILKQDGMPDAVTFYKWMNKDESKLKQYAEACEERATYLVEDMLKIADAQEGDVFTDEEGNKITNHKVIQRDRLRVDTRKWIASKLKPKKYGDKIDYTSGGEKIQIVWQEQKTYEADDKTNEST